MCLLCSKHYALHVESKEPPSGIILNGCLFELSSFILNGPIVFFISISTAIQIYSTLQQDGLLHSVP